MWTVRTVGYARPTARMTPGPSKFRKCTTSAPNSRRTRDISRRASRRRHRVALRFAGRFGVAVNDEDVVAPFPEEIDAPPHRLLAAADDAVIIVYLYDSHSALEHPFGKHRAGITVLTLTPS